jgi:DNA-binding NtrC family response regulator
MSKKILFVDDEPNVLQSIKRGMRSEFELDIACGGQEGLASIQSSGPYAVVVSDMRMPGMNGIEFLEQARALAPDTVRIMLTGNLVSSSNRW